MSEHYAIKLHVYTYTYTVTVRKTMRSIITGGNP